MQRSNGLGDADITKAYSDLSSAEQHASTLESQLQSLEEKLDAFLAEHDSDAPRVNNTGTEIPEPRNAEERSDNPSAVEKERNNGGAGGGAPRRL